MPVVRLTGILRVLGYGLSFDSPLSFAEMLVLLNTLGPWPWAERDSAWYGNLASVRTDSLRLDLLESAGNVDAGNGQQFCISVRSRGEKAPPAHEWAAIEASIRGEMLPLLRATGVQPTDPID